MDIIELADRAWRGDDPHQRANPLGTGGHLAKITDGVVFLPNFGNCTAFETDDGLVMVDTGSIITAHVVHQEIRSWSAKPLHSAIFSHGHIDHVFGVGPFDEEAETNAWRRPTVLAHHLLPKRFERYIMTAGYNQVINRRQFAVANLEWPTDYRFPDETYEHEL
ncbi:MAG TPA: MBL fold metallo-hydrolase, partial [Acidimicrobiales bacterium]